MAEKPVQSKKKALRLSGVERKRLATQQHRPRILDFIANNHYRGLNRDQVVDDLLESTQCTEKDRPSVRGAIAKTLGRLIHDGHLIENLTIGDRPKSRGDGSRVKRHRGYVAVTVNPTSIREARERREAALKNKTLQKVELISQEEVIQWIAEITTKWSPNGTESDPSRDHGEHGNAGKQELRWPREIVLLDIAMTHSSAWDILISVSYHDVDDFMTYVREVVQMAPHVTSTQTIFVAQSVAQIMGSESRDALPA